MKNIPPEQILLATTVGVSLLSALVFLIRIPRFTELVKRFGLYIVVGAGFELYSYWLVFILKNKGNNLYLLHIFTLVEFVLIGWFFGKLLELFEVRVNTKIILFVGAILIILNSLFIQPIDVYNSLSRTAVQLFFMACCFLGFYLFTQRNYPHKDKGVVKLILIALLLKYSGSLFLYLFSNQITELIAETQRKIWLINPSLNFLAQAIILIAFIGFILNPKDSKNKKLRQEYF